MTVRRVHVDRIAVKSALCLPPQRPDVVRRKALLATGVVHRELEACERMLAEDRAVHFVERDDEDPPPRRRIGRERAKMIGHQHLSEDRCGLG